MSANRASAAARTRVLVVIVNYRTAGLTIACLRSLEAEVTADPSIRVTVVENASGDGESLASAIRHNHWEGWVTLICAARNGGFSYGNNRGIESARSQTPPPDYFLLLNSDTEVRAGAIGALVEFLDAHPRVGIAGSGIENPDGSDWPIAFRFHTVWSEFEQGIRLGPVTRALRDKVVARTMEPEPAEVDWVAGASMIIRREVIEEIGPMDEDYFLYFEEVDYCLRAKRATWQTWYVPRSRVMHISGQSTGVSARDRQLRRMPDYWFVSRSRYFVKNHGLAYARIADLAFGIGLALWNLRCRLTGRRAIDPPGMLADFWRTSVLFMSGDQARRRIQGRAAG